MKKALIVQPMAGKVYEELVDTRVRAVEALKKLECDTQNPALSTETRGPATLQAIGVANPKMHSFAGLLSAMSLCQTVYFCKGWEEDAHCKMLHDLAIAFNFEIITE
jgi:hypothetical protein